MFINVMISGQMYDFIFSNTKFKNKPAVFILLNGAFMFSIVGVFCMKFQNFLHMYTIMITICSLLYSTWNYRNLKDSEKNKVTESKPFTKLCMIFYVVFSLAIVSIYIYLNVIHFIVKNSYL